MNYDPGFGVGTHSHEHTEQVMVVTEGELELTVEGETRTLRAGDWAVINRGVEHAVRTENGAQFIEALAPVPLDHVPDRRARPRARPGRRLAARRALGHALEGLGRATRQIP